ncbi:TPA: hypothetical protein U2Q57_000004 [Citrobacter farmeri]|nr:hypothetical protein [Citrobacter farmeri]
MSEVIFSFESSSEAARAGMLMNKADPSLRYVQMRSTVCVFRLTTNSLPLFFNEF